MRWAHSLFWLASWPGIACLACCAAKDNAPEVHVGHPATGPELPAPNHTPSPPGPTPAAWCPCPSGPPGPGLPAPPVATPAPPSSAEQAWCPCPAITQPTPARPLSKYVPNRACASDDQCGDGFCDRGRCAPFWTAVPEYGQVCDASATDDTCSGFLCRDGRCRSCVSDAECPKEAGNGRCAAPRPEFSGRRCGRWIPTILPPASPPPQPSP